MKTHIILVVILFASIQLYSQNEIWERISPKPTESSLKDIAHIPETNRMLAVGAGATILITDDYGVTWNEILNPAGVSRFVNFNAVHFIDSDIGFIAGSKSTVLKTNDGGNSWENISPDGDQTILDIYFFNESVGIITKSGSLWKTYDGGLTWNLLDITGDLNDPHHMHFVNDSLGFFCCEYNNGNKYYISNDAGESWTYDTIFGFDNLSIRAIRFLNPDTGFVSSYSHNDNNLILKTINGGTSWYIVNEHYSIDAHTIYFCNDTIGITVGQEYYWNRFFRTIDGGETWDIVDPACGAIHLNSFAFDNSGNGFCIGDRGFINKSNDWGAAWVCSSENEFRRGLTTCNQVIDDSTILIGMYGYGGGVSTGTVYKSTDSGESWSIYLNLWPVSDMHFVNNDTGYVTCDVFYGEVYKTVNNGSTWQTLIIDEWDLTTKCVHFINEEIGFVGGDGNGSCKLFKTVDGGLTWYEVLGSPQLFYDDEFDFTFITDSIGIAVGPVYPYRYLLRTFDQGETWIRDTISIEAYLKKVEFFDDSTGFILCRYNHILKSINQGADWYEVETGIEGSPHFTDIDFITENVGYITVSNHEYTLIKTIDGGETWFPVNFPTTSTATSIAFYNDVEGLVFGNHGLEFRVTIDTLVGLPEAERDHYADPSFYCYPNPASEIISISLLNENQTIQSIAIYNSLGLFIKSVNAANGNDITTIDVSKLQAGIYLAVAISHENEILATGKFVVR